MDLTDYLNVVVFMLIGIHHEEFSDIPDCGHPHVSSGPGDPQSACTEFHDMLVSQVSFLLIKSIDSFFRTSVS